MAPLLRHIIWIIVQPATDVGLQIPASDGCRITNNRSLLGSASAVIFHLADLDFTDKPKIRNLSQRYIFFTHEAVNPAINADLLPWKMYFNWTMTVRRDSDIAWPYSQMLHLPVTPTPTPMPASQRKAILSKKTKLIAWMVSNCNTQSKREVYVSALEKHVPVDIYGKCGKLECSIDHHIECLQMISDQYRFYLALENNACKDYITEKLFRILDYNIVPIVLKRSVIVTSVPPGSFIALDDFSSPLALANYLKILAENDTAYMEYLRWKQEGWSRHESLEGHKIGICRLCEMLKDNRYSRKVYEDISNWLYQGFHCEPDIGARLASNHS